jgi:hypothetical protein
MQQQQSTRSQTMPCLKYLIFIESIAVEFNGGAYWCTYVEDGDKSYSSHHIVSISKSLHTWNPCQEVSGYLASLSYRDRLSTNEAYTTRPNRDENNNIIAALKHPSRISFLRLHVFGILWHAGDKYTQGDGGAISGLDASRD